MQLRKLVIYLKAGISPRSFLRCCHIVEAKARVFFLQLAHRWYLGVSINQEQAQSPIAYLDRQKRFSHMAVTSQWGWKNSQLQDSEINPELLWKQPYPGTPTTQTPPSEMDGSFIKDQRNEPYIFLLVVIFPSLEMWQLQETSQCPTKNSIVYLTWSVMFGFQFRQHFLI